jgi:hypothetical protein
MSVRLALVFFCFVLLPFAVRAVSRYLHQLTIFSHASLCLHVYLAEELRSKKTVREAFACAYGRVDADARDQVLHSLKRSFAEAPFDPLIEFFCTERDCLFPNCNACACVMRLRYRTCMRLDRPQSRASYATKLLARCSTQPTPVPISLCTHLAPAAHYS